MIRDSARLVQHGVVQRARVMHHVALADHLRVDHHALAVAHLAVERLLQHSVHIVQRHAGQESEAAQIHRQHGNVVIGHQARRGQQRAVASQHDQHVHQRRQLFPRVSLARAGVRHETVSWSQSTWMPRCSSQASSGGTTAASSSRRGREMIPTDANRRALRPLGSLRLRSGARFFGRSLHASPAVLHAVLAT